MVAVLRTGSSVHQTYQPKSRGGHRKLSCMRFARRGHQPSTSPIWPYIHCHPPQPEEIQSTAQGHTEETALALPKRSPKLLYKNSQTRRRHWSRRQRRREKSGVLYSTKTTPSPPTKRHRKTHTSPTGLRSRRHRHPHRRSLRGKDPLSCRRRRRRARHHLMRRSRGTKDSKAAMTMSSSTATIAPRSYYLSSKTCSERRFVESSPHPVPERPPDGEIRRNRRPGVEFAYRSARSAL